MPLTKINYWILLEYNNITRAKIFKLKFFNKKNVLKKTSYLKLTFFIFFTKLFFSNYRSNSGKYDYYRLMPDDVDNLNESPLRPDRPLYIKYHGFNDNGMNGWIIGAMTGKKF